MSAVAPSHTEGYLRLTIAISTQAAPAIAYIRSSVGLLGLRTGLQSCLYPMDHVVEYLIVFRLVEDLVIPPG